MIRKAVLETILLDVDGPQIIVLRDQVDTLYLGLLAESMEERDTFLCTATSSRRLAELRQGRIDLREVFLAPELSEYFAGRVESGLDTTIDLLLESIDVVPQEWLPSEGFFLSDFLPEVPEEATIIAAQATERQRAVIQFHLNPPEADDEARINADRLAHALHSFQNMVRHAYKKVVSALPQNVRRHTVSDESYIMEVFGLVHSSFGVLLQSKTPPDLLGFSNISRALRKIDELTMHLESPMDTLETAKHNRGHLVSAYKNFLRFIVENNTPVTYSWAEPFTNVSIVKRITPEIALSLYHVLVSQTHLGIEELILSGTFRRADVGNRTWLLKTDEGREYSGQLIDSETITLSGVILDTQRYRIVCDEHIAETSMSGRQSTRLFLKEIQRLPGVLHDHEL